MRLLIIEDDKRLRELVQRCLETECYVVDAAKDGEQGFQMAKEHDYDLIVLDNMLPKKSGLEVCQELRLIGKSTPIIMLSVQSETMTKVELLRAGADDYLSKPFSFEELLARVQALLRRPNKVENNVLTAGDLSLDTSKHRVIYKDVEIALSRKELVLLEYFMRNNGLVLSRAMLLEHVWDMNTDPFSNTIESHVMSLRKKFEKVTELKFIHTISGRGYKFEMGNSG